MATRWATAALLLVAVAAFASAVRADGVFRDSVGPIPAGRGGANIAYGDNGGVLLSNPAGMMNMPSNNWLEGSIDTLVTDLDYSDPSNAGAQNSEVFPLPMLSYMHRDEHQGWAAGVGLFVPAGFGADWRMNPPFPGMQQDYRSLGGLIKILPGAAFQVTDNLSVGATLGVAVSHAELEGPFFIQSGPFAGAPTVLDLEATGATPTWSIGMQYQLTDRTTIGAVYSSEDRFNLEGDASAAIFGLAPVPITSDWDAEVELVWPQSVGIGIQHELSDRHRVGADVVWCNWSHAFNRLDLTLTDPSNPAFQVLAPTMTDSLPLEWKDSVSVRTGYEFLYSSRDIFRLGYVFNSDTAPNRTLTPYIPAILDHTLSAGYTRIWHDCRFNCAYQYAFGSDRHVGTSDLVGGDFDSSRLDAAAHWVFLGVSREF